MRYKLKKFPESAGRPRSARLFTIHIVEGRVPIFVSRNHINGGVAGHSHPHAKSEAVVDPSGALKYLINSPLPINHRVRNRNKNSRVPPYLARKSE